MAISRHKSESLNPIVYLVEKCLKRCLAFNRCSLFSPSSYLLQGFWVVFGLVTFWTLLSLSCLLPFLRILKKDWIRWGFQDRVFCLRRMRGLMWCLLSCSFPLSSFMKIFLGLCLMGIFEDFWILYLNE